jgi:hypothetical protein
LKNFVDPLLQSNPIRSSLVLLPFRWRLLAVALLASGCIFGGKSDVDPDAESKAERAEINRNIQSQVDFYSGKTAALRGKPFTRPVFGAMRTRSEYRQAVENEIQATLSDEENALFSRLLAQFGWLPDTLSPFGDLVTDFEAAAPAAYYLPGRDSIYVLSEYADDNEQLQHILPHELIHAWQDQHIGFWDATPEDNGHYDYEFRLWRRCLVEGDAYFGAGLYIAKYLYESIDPGPTALGGVEERRTISVKKWIATAPPDGLFLSQYAPYQFAPAMVGRLHARGGWPAVDSLYSRKGLTTRFVFDPLNPASALTPAPIHFDTADTWGLNPSLSDGGAFGAVDLLALLGKRMDSTDYQDGMGWTGDRYHYRWQPGQPFGVWAWALSFEDTVHSAHAYKALVDHFLARGEEPYQPWTPKAGEDWPEEWGSPQGIRGWEKAGLQGFGLLRGKALVFCENLPNAKSWLETLTIGESELAPSDPILAKKTGNSPPFSRWKQWMASRFRDKVYVFPDNQDF